MTVLDDGTWSATSVPAPAGSDGTVRLGAASELASVLEGGWGALTERPFEGICPTAYDGSESTYRVRRIPQGPGAELADAVVLELRSCTFDLEHPDARAVLDRIDALWEELELPNW